MRSVQCKEKVRRNWQNEIKYPTVSILASIDEKLPVGLSPNLLTMIQEEFSSNRVKERNIIIKFVGNSGYAYHLNNSLLKSMKLRRLKVLDK